MTQRDTSPSPFPLKDSMTKTFGLEINQTPLGSIFCLILDCVTPAQGMTSWSRQWSCTMGPSRSATTCSSSLTWTSPRRTLEGLFFSHPYFSRAGCKRQGEDQYLGILICSLQCFILGDYPGLVNFLFRGLWSRIQVWAKLWSENSTWNPFFTCHLLNSKTYLSQPNFNDSANTQSSSLKTFPPKVSSMWTLLQTQTSSSGSFRLRTGTNPPLLFFGFRFMPSDYTYLDKVLICRKVIIWS